MKNPGMKEISKNKILKITLFGKISKAVIKECKPLDKQYIIIQNNIKSIDDHSYIFHNLLDDDERLFNFQYKLINVNSEIMKLNVDAINNKVFNVELSSQALKLYRQLK
jgi:hypothetical protein